MRPYIQGQFNSGWKRVGCLILFSRQAWIFKNKAETFIAISQICTLGRAVYSERPGLLYFVKLKLENFM